MTSGLWLEQRGRCDAAGVGWGRWTNGRSGCPGDQESGFERVKFKMPIRQPSGDAQEAAGRRSQFWERCGLGMRTGDSPPAS